MPTSTRQRAIAKLHRTIGDPAQRPVGADASVRPWGNCGFAAAVRKNGCAACGSMWASTPTNELCIRIGTFVFEGASCRADRVIRPYGCVRVRIGAFNFVMLYRAGGVEPRTYGSIRNAIETHSRGEGQAPPLRYDEIREDAKTRKEQPFLPSSFFISAGAFRRKSSARR